MKKRLLSVLLALALVIGFIPVYHANAAVTAIEFVNTADGGVGIKATMTAADNMKLTVVKKSVLDDYETDNGDYTYGGIEDIDANWGSYGGAIYNGAAIAAGDATDGDNIFKVPGLGGSSHANLEFVAWAYDDGSSAVGSVPATITLNAQGKVPVTPHNITWDANGADAGFSDAGGATTVEEGTKGNAIAKPTTPPTKSGYRFMGWFDATTNGNAIDQNYTTPNGSDAITFYAQWAQEYTVTYALDGGNGTAPTTGNKIAGEKFNLAASTGITKTGYTFGGWNDGTKTTNAGAQYTMGAANTTLTAVWTANELTMANVADAAATYNTAITTISLPVASNGTGDYTYTLTGDLPAGLTYNADAKTITGTPTEVVEKTLTWKAVDDNSAKEVEKTFKITVSPAAFTGTVAIAMTTDANNDEVPNTGDTLTATVTNDNTSGSFGYQWKRNGNVIPGATGATYEVTAADMDQRITCTVTATGNYTGSADSNQIQPGKKELTGQPVITGEGEVGAELTLEKGTLPAELSAFDIQWKKNGVAISGATGETYTVKPEDQGAAISATVTPKADSTYGGSADSSNQVSVAILPEAPGAPENLTVVPGDGTLTVTWKEPENMGTKPLKYYVISVDGEVVKRTTAQSVEISELENGTEYTITVTTVTDDGESDPAEATGTPEANAPDMYTVTYTVDTAKGNSIASQEVEDGTVITLPTVTAKDGYKFVGWTLDGTAVTGNVTITEDTEFVAVFEELVKPEPHIAYINGRPDDENGGVKFVPDDYLPRSEAAIILARVTEGFDKDTTYASASFTDLGGEYCANYVAFCVSRDLIKGKTATTFEPKTNVTRAEFATMLARMYYGGDEFVPEDTCERFTDGTASGEYYEKYIAVLEDFITGYPDGSFRPGNEITRAEAVTMVNAVLHRSQSTKTTDPQLDVESIFPDVKPGQWFFNNVMEATNEHDKDAPLFNIDPAYHK